MLKKKVFLKEIVIDQIAALFFCKGLDTKYFRLCGDMIPILNTQLSPYNGQTAVCKKMGRTVFQLICIYKGRRSKGSHLQATVWQTLMENILLQINFFMKELKYLKALQPLFVKLITPLINSWASFISWTSTDFPTSTSIKEGDIYIANIKVLLETDQATCLY